ncbi:MAG: prolipoprotein diacylglyceryl transferase [Candidatus Acidulodesulfobacterium acidiphilum]|uniref:Phosphatidylglycerol--prolipoprotein diacylglyceryl transferase n=1 Tax=Candidatus Acidulodesulfobacterium acidiphilum TaxID=2597224 RepID=A0A520X7C7_9DELT|nr:MAG: prolipoprotein diacylglyceryl transferase [Candidatus Acidulodesulfobacterium acidiphilum]
MFNFNNWYAPNPIVYIGPLPVHWYGILIGIGFIIGITIAYFRAKSWGEDPENIINIMVFAIPVSIIFARLYYVVFAWGYYANNPISIFYIWQGGLAIYGGEIGGLITLYLYTRIKKLNIWRYIDMLAPSLLLGQAIGRWGNFIDQQAFGYPVKWGLPIAKALRPVNAYTPKHLILGLWGYPFQTAYPKNLTMYSHFEPSFFFESIPDFLGFIFLMWLSRKKPKVAGTILIGYLIWYGTTRFFTEGTRIDSLWLGNSIRVSQVLSMFAVIISIAVIIYRHYKYKDVKDTIN